MRLPSDVRSRFLARFCALGLAALLAGCGVFNGGDRGADMTSVEASDVNPMAGPAADYPVVVGDPYEIDGKLYTPRDTMNYDEVGLAVSDSTGGAGVTVAHRTLPMPSYVEITALATGRTILARVERRGPMTGSGVVALSSDAKAQLEVVDGAPVRIRRVNPVEADRAKLRIGEAAPLRMETPKSLLAVLMRKLSNEGAVSLAAAKPPAPASTAAPVAASKNELPPVRQAPVVAKAAAVVSRAAPKSFEDAFSSERKAATAYPLKPLDAGAAVAAPVRVSAIAPTESTAAPPVVVSRVSEPQPAVRSALQSAPAAKGNFVVQAAAFSSKANAERAANSIDGFVERSGRFYRVRTGPFVNRGQAEAALAKVRAAGYRDARVYTAG